MSNYQSLFKIISIALNLAKVDQLLQDSSQRLEHDEELPLSIKALFIRKREKMNFILQKMYSRPSHTLLKSKHDEPQFPSYKAIALELKQKLIKDKDPSGITFQGRSIELFKWCRQELSETRNPLVRILLSSPEISEEEKQEIETKFDTLSDISNLLIHFIGACDDASDTIQDERLTRFVTRIPYISSPEEKQELLESVSSYRDGIFTPYFEKIVAIWEDAIDQLKELFGEDHFNTHINDKFLNIFSTIVNSLSYSVYLNIRPHDDSIEISDIYTKLAPNIMVQCFRYLEESLVKTYENHIKWPSQEDLTILDSIIIKSQSNAASSNAAATMSRELKENDLSSPFPFAINDTYQKALKNKRSSYVKDFEEYIKQEGYTNGFFGTYYESKPGDEFDYLSLLLLRRLILSNVYSEIEHISKKSTHQPPLSDYMISTIGDETLQIASESSDENVLMRCNLIKKYKRHIDLIDSYSDKLTLSTKVYDTFFQTWETEIQEMRNSADQIHDSKLKEKTQEYIDSWEDFLCMYLLFKRTFDGTI